MPLKDIPSVETMPINEAQETVLNYCSNLIEAVWKDTDKNTRFKAYQEVAKIVESRYLPEAEVDALSGKIINLEWHGKSIKMMNEFLENHGLQSFAGRYSPQIKEAFDKTLLLFSRSEQVIKDWFFPIFNYNQKTGEHSVSNKPWPLRDLLLVEAVGFNQEEKQLIAQSWLAGYFIHGKTMVENEFYYGSDKDKYEQEQKKAITLFMEEFGVNNNQVKEVAQSVIRQFSNKRWIIPDINDFLKNTTDFFQSEPLDWISFTQEDLVKVFDNSRIAGRVGLWRAQQSKDNRPGKDSQRANLVYWLTPAWYEEEIKKGLRNIFISELNKMSENNFFQTLDNYLLIDAENLGKRVGLDEQKITKAFNKTKSFKAITVETDKIIKIENERNKKIEQQREKNELEKKLEEINILSDYARNKRDNALMILAKPGVLPE